MSARRTSPASSTGSGRAVPNVSRLRRLTLDEVEDLAGRLVMPSSNRASLGDIVDLERWARALSSDGRAGCVRRGRRLAGVARACRQERLRVAGMVEAEVGLCPPDASRVAGIDEAGRGPLAGPVVAAAVVLRPGEIIPGLNDSKQVPEPLREELYPSVIEASLAVGVGIAGTGLIERINILQATYVAMRRAAARLGVRPDYALVDGFRVPGLDVPHRGIVRGDATCASIAAASIVAKVTRDRIMRHVAERFPGYAFERNKGYATVEHWAALERFGPCPAHRRSFLGALGPPAVLFAEDEPCQEEVPGGDD